MLKRISMITALSLALLQPQAWANHCAYELDKSSVQVNWTAFKTTQKVAVNGSFPKVTLSGDLKGKDLQHLLGQLEADLQIGDATQIQTGNPARDTTLFQHFFSLFRGKGKVHGAIHGVKIAGTETEPSGTFDLKLTLNKQTKVVPFKFTVGADGVFNATGAIDVMDFNLGAAHADLHKTCETLHTGADGVSKTWTNVDLKLVAKLKTECHAQ